LVYISISQPHNTNLHQCIYVSTFYYALTQCNAAEMVTGQFADKPTCGQSSSRLVNSQTSQLDEMF